MNSVEDVLTPLTSKGNNDQSQWYCVIPIMQGGYSKHYKVFYVMYQEKKVRENMKIYKDY